MKCMQMTTFVKPSCLRALVAGKYATKWHQDTKVHKEQPEVATWWHGFVIHCYPIFQNRYICITAILWPRTKNVSSISKSRTDEIQVIPYAVNYSFDRVVFCVFHA